MKLPGDRPASTPEEADQPPAPVRPTPPGLPLPQQPAAASTSEKPLLVATVPGNKEPLLEAMQCILANRPNDALKHLQGYDAATQELLLRLLPYLDLIRRKSLPQLQPEEVAILHDQLQEMMHFLRPRTELVIAKACFCENIKVFGVYKPLPEDYVFNAPSGDRPGELVQLYVELRNFCSEPRGAFHETCLSSTVEIRDAKGEKIWQHHFDNRQQVLRSRARLNDYYGNYTFHVPPLPPGTYTVALEIVDETRPEHKRLARKNLELRVRSLPGPL